MAALTALVVPATALAPAQATGGSGGSWTGSVTIVKGGDRTARTTVGGLAGASFDLYQVGDAWSTSGGTKVGSCTTTADGACTVAVSARSSAYYYSVETSAPTGWSVIDAWGSDALRYTTGRMDSGRRTVVLPGTGRWWPNVRANNTAPTKCGINLGLVMDTSSSIDDSRLGVFRTAAKGIVDTLANTPSRISLSRFDDDADPVLPLTSVATSQGVAQLKSAISDVDGSGWTNWDEALWESATGDLDVLLFLTDGDPTQNMAGTGNGTVRLRDLEEAVHSANALKAKGTQVVAVGIGITEAGSIKRLNLISSPADTYTVSWDQLAQKIKGLAAGQCEGTLTLQKRVRDADGTWLTAPERVNGWEFAGTASAGTLGAFPATATVNGAAGFTSATYTGAQSATPTITLAETLKPGYEFHGASCTVNGQSVSVTEDTAAAIFSFKGKAGAVMNCVVVNKVKPTPMADLTVTKTAATAYARDWAWAIAKDVDSHRFEVGPDGKARATYSVTVTPSERAIGNFRVHGAITVTNPNPVAFTGVTVADQIGGTACTITGGESNRTVPAQGTLVVTYACDDAAGTPAGTGTNTATVSWNKATYYGTTGRAVGTAAYSYADAVVTTSHGTARVTDTMIDIDGIGPDGVLVEAADGPRTFTYTRELTSPAGTCTEHPNTATVQPVPGEGTAGAAGASDSETVTVCTEARPTVDVTVAGDLERSYPWSIAKDVDATKRTVDPATGRATFHYAVTVKAGDPSTSGARLAGSVKVTNHNQYVDGSLAGTVALTNTFGAGTVCTATGGAQVTVAAGATVDVPFTCAVGAGAAERGAVTAAFGWDPAGTAAVDSVGDSAEATLGVRAETNKIVDVVDDKTVPGQRVVLAEDLVWEPGLVRTYTYDLALAGGAEGACLTWTNTATVDLTSGTDPSAQAGVQACGTEVLPSESFGKAVGSLKASCQGTVTAKLLNESGVSVRYTLKVGKRSKNVTVASLKGKRVQLKGAPHAKAKLMIDKRVLDRIRVPKRCKAPETLPETGLRTSALTRIADLLDGWLV